MVAYFVSLFFMRPANGLIIQNTSSQDVCEFTYQLHWSDGFWDSYTLSKKVPANRGYPINHPLNHEIYLPHQNASKVQIVDWKYCSEVPNNG